MRILIKGMEMPKRMPIKAIIYPDGRVTVTNAQGEKKTYARYSLEG